VLGLDISENAVVKAKRNADSKGAKYVILIRPML